jgi:hypothetical protein
MRPTPEQLENREVKATSVAWSTSLTAVYETDPRGRRRVAAAGTDGEPLVRVSVKRVDLRWAPAVRRRHLLAVQARHEGQVGNYPLVMPMTTEHRSSRARPRRARSWPR